MQVLSVAILLGDKLHCQLIQYNHQNVDHLFISNIHVLLIDTSFNELIYHMIQYRFEILFPTK